MTETDEHTKLKDLAKNMLINMGFKLDEIHEEYRVEVNSFTKGRNFRVDVCGISNNNRADSIGKSVAIECGKTSAEKLVNLNLFFDEVYQLPYGLKKIDDFDKIYDDAIKEISELKETIKSQQSKIRELEHQNENLVEKAERWNKSVLLIKVLHDILFKNTFAGYWVSDKDIQDLLDFLKINEL